MAPFEVMNASTNINNDEAFLNLLSSQRELLRRLNTESAISKGRTAVKPLFYERQSLFGSQDALSLMDKPITEKKGSLDIFFPRRLSIGYGSEIFNPFYDVTHEVFNEKGKGSFFSSQSRTKRRKSNVAVDSCSFVNFDGQNLPHYRRSSILSTFSDFDENLGLEQTPTEVPSSMVEKLRMDPSISTETVRNNLIAFVSAMENSRKSQQEIHAWDRKMGLKRSHSKTMRMTMRSRKKLKFMLKRDINSLS